MKSLLKGVILYVNLCTALAAHARKRPTIVRSRPISQHDKQVTTFSPQGQLLQLHYAQLAANKGHPSLYFQMNDETIIFLCRSSVGYGKMGDKNTKPTTTRPVALTPNKSVVRIHDSILGKFTGLQGDGRLLSKHLRANAMMMHSNFGIEDYPQYLNVKYIVELCAEVQHSLTIRSGARPLAVQAVFMGKCGVDRLGLWKVDVGGFYNECKFCYSGNLDLLGWNEGQVLQKMQDLYSLQDDNVECDITSNDLFLSKIIVELGKILLTDKYSFASNNSNSVASDIYVMKVNPSCRGGIQIQCATCVKEEDLEEVSTLFS